MVTRTHLSVTLCLVTITAAAVVLPQVLHQLIQNYRIYKATTNSISISEVGKICICVMFQSFLFFHSCWRNVLWVWTVLGSSSASLAPHQFLMGLNRQYCQPFHMPTPLPHYYGLLLFNPLNAELNPICYLLALLGAHHFLHVSRIRVKSLTLRLLMSYIYGAPILDVSRSHTMHHSR